MEPDRPEEMYKKALYLVRLHVSQGNRENALEVLSTIPPDSDVYGDALRIAFRRTQRRYLIERLEDRITFH